MYKLLKLLIKFQKYIDLLCVIIDILASLDIGGFLIKLNNRKFLDAMI